MSSQISGSSKIWSVLTKRNNFFSTIFNELATGGHQCLFARLIYLARLLQVCQLEGETFINSRPQIMAENEANWLRGVGSNYCLFWIIRVPISFVGALSFRVHSACCHGDIGQMRIEHRNLHPTGCVTISNNNSLKTTEGYCVFQ